jgi:putative hemolysin
VYPTVCPIMDALTLSLIAVPVVLLSAASALFSAMQVAVATLQPGEVKDLCAAHPSVARPLERLVLQPNRVMGGLFLADTLANLPLIILCLFLFTKLPQTALLPNWAIPLILFGLIVLVCDLIPKAFALSRPLLVARATCGLIARIGPMLEPVSDTFENFADRIASLLLPARMKPRNSLDDEELGTLVRLGEEDGTLGSEESEMIQEILKLADKTAKDCMTPRVDIYSLPDDLDLPEAVDRLKRIRYRRVPVYGETPDDILGILDAAEFLMNPQQSYAERLQPPSFVPQTMRALDLLKAFIARKQAQAIVLDEFGGVNGLVTISEIVEEILGDAVPTDSRTLYIERLEDGRVVAGGHARLDDLAEEFELPYEEEGVDTAGGLVFNLLGHTPAPGEEVVHRGLRYRVRRMGRKRVTELIVERVPGEEGGDEESGEKA